MPSWNRDQEACCLLTKNTCCFVQKKVADKIVGALPQSIKSLSPLVCRGVVKKVGITERGVKRDEGGRNSVGQIETEREG